MAFVLDLFKFLSVCAERDLHYQPITENLLSAVFKV